MLPGPTELALILVIVLILFGAGKLPQVFEAFGQGVKKFREAQQEEDRPKDVTPRTPSNEEVQRYLEEKERAGRQGQVVDVSEGRGGAP